MRGYTQWFSKRLSNCKRGRQLLRGHALQALGSLPRCACARGGLSPGRSRENVPFPRSADCRSAVNALWGPDLQAVGRSEFPAMMRGGGRSSRCCAPLDPSFMAGVEDLPLGFHKGFHLANQKRSTNPRDLVVECEKGQGSESGSRKWAGCLIRPG